MRKILCLLCLLLGISAVGCGPSARELKEQTLSTLNTVADQWGGGKDFATDASDAYGRPLTCTVEKTTLNYVLEVRSNGSDGLPKNSDDVVVRRTKRHGETTITQEAEKAAKGVSRGVGSGLVQGIKKGLSGSGGDKK